MKILNITPEIGFAIKKLRIQYNKTAKEIAELETIGKTRSYFSKLEKGEVKKVDINLFISILNAITDTNKGLNILLDSIADSFDEFDDINKILFTNLDDIVCQIVIDNKFLDYVNKIIIENSLSVQQICDKINQNSDLKDLSPDTYKNLSENIWYSSTGKYNDIVIKLHYEPDYIDKILKGLINTTNYITLLGMLYSIYQFIYTKREDAKRDAVKLISDFGMSNSRFKHIKSRTIDLDESFSGLDPTTVETYQSIITQLKILLVINPEYTSKKIKVLESNLKNDLGFTFAFITSELSDILDLSKDTKQKFLYDIKDLLQKYSLPEQQSLDLYMDE